MHIARSIAQRLNELRLQQAVEAAHRARVDYLRQDLRDGDCDRCARRVRAAEARARSLEAALASTRAAREPLRH
jgi:hypothetical protein